MNSMKDFTNVQYVHCLLDGTSQVIGRPDPFALHKQPSNLNFFASSKFALLLVTFWRTFSQIHAVQSCSSLF